MQYHHVQRGKWHLVLLAFAAAMGIEAWLGPREPVAQGLLAVAALVMAACAAMFGWLSVRDEGDGLALRYGPWTVFRKRIPYAEITAVEPGTTSIIDGWGIHRIPGRGWTYNLWGFGCVKLRLGRRVLRIGTDDVDGLARFLRGKMPRPDRPPSDPG